MNSDDKDLHQDIGSLKEFKDWAKGEFDRVHSKLDVVLAAKWRAEGGAAVIAGLVSLGVAGIIEYLRKS